MTRKLGHKIMPFTVQQKAVQKTFDVILKQLDTLVKETILEEASDKELQKAVMEARRAENMIKYKEEI